MNIYRKGVRAAMFARVITLLIVFTAFHAYAQNADSVGTVFTYDFENGAQQGWGQRGSMSVSVVSEAAHSGAFGFKASDREQTWSGPAIQLKDTLKPGAEYAVSAWIRLAKAQATPSTVKLTMEEKNSAGKTDWKTIAEAKVASADWVELKGLYSFTDAMDGLTLYAETSNTADTIYLDDARIEMTVAAPKSSNSPASQVITIQKDVPSLKDRLKGSFTLGTAVTPENISGISGEIIAKHFNSIVAENAMKPMYVHPSENTFYWGDADKIVAYAKTQGIELRYHTLLWHEQVPNWFFLDANGKEMIDETDPAKREANKRLLLKRIETHVTTIVSRYKNDIRSWDAVNEVVDPAGPNGMRNSKWYQIAGTDYIETVFRAARAAGGNKIKLFINDYGTQDPTKRDILYKLVKDMLAKGVPIDGVGHQTHISVIYPPVGQIADSIKLFASLGLENQITELDISVYSDDTTAYAKVPDALVVQQGYRCKELFDTLSKLGGAITNVTFWGISDKDSWLNNRPIPRRDAPLLFDDAYQVKPAYWGIIDPTKLPPEPEKTKPKREPKLGEAARGTATIDGKIETAWSKANVLDVNLAAAGKPTATAKVRVLWDEKFLYVLAEVSDPVLDNKAPNDYEKDSVELYLDESNEKAGAYQADDAQYRVTFEGTQSFGSNGPAKDFSSAVARTKAGYLVEAAIPFKMIKPTEGLVVGFDAQVNDADGNGKRQGISKWNDESDNSYRDTLNWGTLKLGK